MEFVHVKPEDAQRIAQLRLKQDQNAVALGVATWEFLKEREKLGSPPDLLRLGALYSEYEMHKQFIYNRIKLTQQEQAAAGDAALRAVGIDPNSGTYTIAEDRVHVPNESGAWVPMAKEPQP